MDESTDFDPVYATRIISDIVPNPWVARELVGNLLASLIVEGFDAKKLGELSSLILEELRKYLMTQRDKLAEAHFFGEVSAARIQFRLRTDAHNWPMPMTMDTSHPLNALKLSRKTGDPVERSLFAPAYKHDFNGDEEDFACYLDEQAALKWWHRNVAKSGQYFVQGWRKNRVPGFYFCRCA
jgi:type III restriction enzyme